MSKLHRLFDRTSRLLGQEAMLKLKNSHVMIIGLGGVGSWAAESIIRSGVGAVTLVDFDLICITNANRQILALSNNAGQSKVKVMCDRLLQINPEARINPVDLFYNPENCGKVFSQQPDFVIDAIDHVTSKCHLLDYCRKEKIPVICSTGSGGRLDPTMIRIADLAKTEVDPLAHALRRILRTQYGFPQSESQRGKGEFGIPAVFSTEQPRDPLPSPEEEANGYQCICPQGNNPYFNCTQRNQIMGTAAFVTGAFGFTCASYVVRRLTNTWSQCRVELENRLEVKASPA